MKTTVIISILIFLACTVTSTALPYDILYVNAANLTPVPPFDTWEKAAPTIQTAIDAASAKDHIIVTNGVYDMGRRITPGYALSNRVLITNNITVRSVNGPEGTIILGKESSGGGNGDGAVRCVYMTTGKIYGFTISNGFTLTTGSLLEETGGGIWLTTGCAVTNCTISGNSASDLGGGTYCYGGSVSDCSISGNTADNYGGGVYFNSGGSLSDCTISGNNAGSGGGVYCDSRGSVSDCSISGNSANYFGGGVNCYDSSVSDCSISGNSANYFGGGVYCYDSSVSDCSISGNTANKLGGGFYVYQYGSLTNCLIYGMNSADYGGGAYMYRGGSIINSTIAGNNAMLFGGGICSSNGGSVINTIIYDNQAGSGNDNWLNYASGANIRYSCTTPTNGLPNGHRCIPDDPLFVNSAEKDYHLLEGSPCIDEGFNMAWMDPPATDLDGNARIFGGTVDMGCYEFVPEPFGLSFIMCYLLFIIRKFNLIKISG